ncbi:hypothetical protein SAMN05216421_2312 [Halopseudomonas xinjiangensis]|uniref:Pyridoxamine 5'-phosphate oxidase N-terminal domain-containing protein n=1 Tax=Halopseudomonas xinjiangensis TaxID=487184 RepID=A0A1H1VID5_9GAMM|nr:pyridoxamine 5'-phosphate oxidase family protein [Halopseudomonas xinjiangensis]SDS84618.1 hypothetical protein SAMN05216421_2312 [Halopseudomonas xinjiangensis]
MDIDTATLVTTTEQLTGLYASPSERAKLKQIDHLDVHCRAFIAASPFFALSTCGKSGADCSPRGDSSGSVLAVDEHTLLIADRRGNNRLDSLRNILDNPSVGLLFLIPGRNETLRVNGRAQISRDPALLARFEVAGKLPVTVLVVRVDEAFIHCARALVRGGLWETRAQTPAVPSIGTMLAAHTQGKVDAQAYDEQVAAHLKDTLY